MHGPGDGQAGLGRLDHRPFHHRRKAEAESFAAVSDFRAPDLANIESLLELTASWPPMAGRGSRNVDYFRVMLQSLIGNDEAYVGIVGALASGVAVANRVALGPRPVSVPAPGAAPSTGPVEGA